MASWQLIAKSLLMWYIMRVKLTSHNVDNKGNQTKIPELSPRGFSLVRVFFGWTLTFRLCHRLEAVVQPFADDVSNNTCRDSYDKRADHGQSPLSLKIGVWWHRKQYNGKILTWQVDSLLPKVCWCDILYKTNVNTLSLDHELPQMKNPELGTRDFSLLHVF